MSDNLPNFRDRKFLALLYPDCPEHVAARDKIVASYSHACILHDKDINENGELKKPHWHFVLRFQNQRWRDAVAVELGIESYYLEKAASFDASLLYLVHDNAPTQYQYDISEVSGDLVPNLAKLLVADDEGSRVLEILKIIDDHDGVLSYRTLLRIVCNNGLYADFRRMGSGVKYLLDEHNSIYSLSSNRSCSEYDRITENARFDGYVMGNNDLRERRFSK